MKPVLFARYLIFSIAPPDPQPLLVLNCLILGDSRNNIFPVEIARAKSVGSLKKAIREEKHPAFQHIASDTLTLWDVSEVVDANLENTLAEIHFEEREPLSPVARLSKVFSNSPVEDRLHIVIGRPTEGGLCGFLWMIRFHLCLSSAPVC